MATLTIKNLPDELHHRLKQRAMAHHRSVNGEVIACLERAVNGGPADPEAFPRSVRENRERLSRIWATDKDLKKARNWGRP